MMEIPRVMVKGKPAEKAIGIDQLPGEKKDPAHAFYLEGSEALYTIRDLIERLLGMPDEQFRQYVNDDKNDFANWMTGTFMMPQLAEKMRQAKDKAAMKKAIETYFMQTGHEAEQVELQKSEQSAEQKAGQKKEQKEPGNAGKNAQAKPEKGAGVGNNWQINGQMDRIHQYHHVIPIEGVKPMNEDEAAEVLKKMKELSAKRFAREFATQETEDSTSGMREAFNELKKRVSAMRKEEGKHYFFTGLLMKRIEPQVRLCLITNERKDIEKLKEILKELEVEIEQERKEEEINVKKEVDQIVAAQAASRVASGNYQGNAKT